MILKNTASQGVYLFASNKTTGVGLAGDQANITGNISKDGAAEAAFSTTNPTNIGGGLYWQPLSQAETNCNAFGLRWASSTADILIDPLIGFTDQGIITSRASQTSVDTLTTYVDTEVVTIKAKTDNIPASPATEGTLTTISGYLDTEIANIQSRLPDTLVSGNLKAKIMAFDDTLGTEDGVQLSAIQPNYAPALAGDEMALTDPAIDAIWLDAPASTPLSAIADAVVAHTDFITLLSKANLISDLKISGSVDDVTPTAATFDGNSALSSTNDWYNNSVLVFTSGVLKGIPRKITDYVGSTRTFTFTTAFPAAPANDDSFDIIGVIE